MQRQEDEAKVEARVRRLGHHAAEKGQLLKILPWRAAIMHAIGDAGVPELVREPRLLQHLTEAYLHVVALRKLRPHHQAELHVSHSRLPLCSSALFMTQHLPPNWRGN